MEGRMERKIRQRGKEKEGDMGGMEEERGEIGNNTSYTDNH